MMFCVSLILGLPCFRSTADMILIAIVIHGADPLPENVLRAAKGENPSFLGIYLLQYLILLILAFRSTYHRSNVL